MQYLCDFANIKYQGGGVYTKGINFSEKHNDQNIGNYNTEKKKGRGIEINSVVLVNDIKNVTYFPQDFTSVNASFKQCKSVN